MSQQLIETYLIEWYGDATRNEITLKNIACAFGAGAAPAVQETQNWNQLV